MSPPLANTSCRHCSPANQAMTRASIAEKSDTMNFLPFCGTKAVRMSWDRVSGTSS